MAPSQPTQQQPDPRPGFYYVSVRNGTGRNVRNALLAGPWATHAPALTMVEAATRATVEVDPWAWFYAYGTCRTPTNWGPGRLNDQLGLNLDADGLVILPPQSSPAGQAGLTAAHSSTTPEMAGRAPPRVANQPATARARLGRQGATTRTVHNDDLTPTGRLLKTEEP